MFVCLKFYANGGRPKRWTMSGPSVMGATVINVGGFHVNVINSFKRRLNI